VRFHLLLLPIITLKRGERVFERRSAFDKKHSCTCFWAAYACNSKFGAHDLSAFIAVDQLLEEEEKERDALRALGLLRIRGGAFVLWEVLRVIYRFAQDRKEEQEEGKN